MPQDYYPVLLALGIGAVVGLGMMIVSQLFGRQVGGATKLSTYESGVPLLDRSRKRLSIAFFLIAIDFIVFDLEVAFLFLWALVMRAGGWPLFWAVMVFIGLILVGFAYVWRKGGFDLGPQRKTGLVPNPGLAPNQEVVR